MLPEPSLSTRSEPGCMLSGVSEARYKPPTAGAWYDPGNWSPATLMTPLPHSDQVPCQHDRAVFPPGMTYKVSVEESEVTVSQVRINNKELDSVATRAFLRTEVGRTMFNVTRRVRVSGDHCRDRRGCTCGTRHLEQTICGHVTRTGCPDTMCRSPLRPAGHCCYNFCGAVINVESRGIVMGMLEHLAQVHSSGQLVLSYVRRLDTNHHQILLVPDTRGNLTNTHAAAAKIQDFLLVELGSGAVIWTEYSGASPPPGLIGKLK